MVDFNCQCEETSTYDTLLTLRTRMMVNLGFAAQKANPPPSMSDLIDGWLFDAQTELYAKNPSLRTERRFRWTMTEGEGFYGIKDNDAPPDFEDVDCAKTLNEYSIRAVWLEDLNGSFMPLTKGIPMALYNSVDQTGFPSRYEIRSCIEVFPRPNADGLKLWMVGQMDLDAFSSNTDRTTIDSHLVYLWALAAGKAHYGKKDAQNAQNRAGSYLLDVIAGKHATARYIPRYAVPPPEVQPVMTVYNT
jgi:hypothetical protein